MAAGTPRTEQQRRSSQPSTKGPTTRSSSSIRSRRQQQRQGPANTGSSSSTQGDVKQLSARFLLDYERKGFCLTKSLLQPQQLRPVKECVQAVIEQQRLDALKHRCERRKAATAAAAAPGAARTCSPFPQLPAHTAPTVPPAANPQTTQQLNRTCSLRHHIARVRVLCPPEVGSSSRLDNITSPQQALQLIASHGSSELGFLQFFNLHRSQPAISQLVRDPQLAGTAVQLLGARRIRLYQVRVCCCVLLIFCLVVCCALCLSSGLPRRSFATDCLPWGSGGVGQAAALVWWLGFEVGGLGSKNTARPCYSPPGRHRQVANGGIAAEPGLGCW